MFKLLKEDGGEKVNDLFLFLVIFIMIFNENIMIWEKYFVFIKIWY